MSQSLKSNRNELYIFIKIPQENRVCVCVVVLSPKISKSANKIGLVNVSRQFVLVRKVNGNAILDILFHFVCFFRHLF